MTFSELIAAYLFLGGTAAGAYAVLASLDVVWSVALRRRTDASGENPYGPARLCEQTYQRIRRIVYGVTLGIVIMGVLCLIADLGRPDAFYYLLLYPTNSLISIGALALSLLIGSSLAAFCDATFSLSARTRRVMRVLKVAGIPVAFVILAYTGMLMKSVVAVNFWQTAWLPVLFVLSALSCGCAVVLLAACSCEDRRAVQQWDFKLLRFDFAFVVLELVVTILLLLSLSQVASPDVLHDVLAGRHSLLFWAGFVLCALLLPIAIELFSLIGRRHLSVTVTAFASVFVLVGGLSLRLVMVAAGVQPVV